MVAQNLKVDNIANNIANVNTNGYKRSSMHFEDLLYQQISGTRVVSRVGAETVEGVQVGRGVRVVGNQKIFSQGAIETTGRPLDMAINGDGFFQVQLSDGSTAFSRDGSFNISDRGVLTTQAGYTLMPGITVPEGAREITVSASGVVSVVVNGSTDPEELGRIEMARFINPAGLMNLGENLYQETPASGTPVVGYPDEDGIGRIIQGGLESSNVEIVQEMVELIAAQRAYELNSKTVQATNEMMGQTSAMVR